MLGREDDDQRTTPHFPTREAGPDAPSPQSIESDPTCIRFERAFLMRLNRTDFSYFRQNLLCSRP